MDYWAALWASVTLLMLAASLALHPRAWASCLTLAAVCLYVNLLFLLDGDGLYTPQVWGLLDASAFTVALWCGQRQRDRLLCAVAVMLAARACYHAAADLPRSEWIEGANMQYGVMLLTVFGVSLWNGLGRWHRSLQRWAALRR